MGARRSKEVLLEADISEEKEEEEKFQEEMEAEEKEEDNEEEELQRSTAWVVAGTVPWTPACDGEAVTSGALQPLQEESPQNHEAEEQLEVLLPRSSRAYVPPHLRKKLGDKCVRW